MKKGKFFKSLKDVKKSGMKTVGSSFLSGGTFLAGKAGMNYATTKITNVNAQKAVGPAVAVAGMVLEAFAENPYIAAAGRGMAIAGIDRSAQDFIPDETKSKMYLSGVGATERKVDGGKGGQYDQNYWEDLNKQAVAEANKAAENFEKGNDSPENSVNGLKMDAAMTAM